MTDKNKQNEDPHKRKFQDARKKAAEIERRLKKLKELDKKPKT